MLEVSTWRGLAAPCLWAILGCLILVGFSIRAQTKVDAQQDSNAVALELKPTGKLMGELVPPVGFSADVETLRLRLESPPGTKKSLAIQQTTVLCPVDVVEKLLVWHCEVPAGRYDLKLSWNHCVPIYLWDVEVQTGQSVDVGSLALQAGSSVAGWVRVQDSVQSMEAIELHLLPATRGWFGNPAQRKRHQSQRHDSKVDARGFFQFVGVSPGTYELLAEGPEMASVRIQDIEIGEAQEKIIESDFEMFPIPLVEVQLDPPCTPSGEPWRVTLNRLDPRTGVLTEIIQALASKEGTFARRIDAMEERLHLQIADEDNTWTETWVDVTPQMRPTFLKIPVVAIEGRVLLGEDGLSARVVFGSTQGALRITMNTNEEGFFSGYLPHEGLWPVDLAFADETSTQQAVEPVEVRVNPAKGKAVVDIRLPSTRLMGEVFQTEEPVPGAYLVLMREGEQYSRESILKADRNGQFELLGLSPGTLQIQAYKGKASSSWQRIELQEDFDREIRLELETKIELNGLVLSSNGEVQGASVLARPVLAGDTYTFIERRRTDEQGLFVLSLPSRAVAADLIVSAPGLATRILRIGVNPKGGELAMVHLEAAGGMVSIPGGASLDPKTHYPSSRGSLSIEGASFELGFLLGHLLPLGGATIDEQGLLLGPLQPGSYTICDGGNCAQGFLGPASQLTLAFPEPDGSPETATGISVTKI